MNPILPLAMETLIFAATYLLASAVTWPLRRRCRHVDVLTLDAGGCLRHMFAHMSRSLAVIAFTGVTIWLAMNLNWRGALLPPEAHKTG